MPNADIDKRDILLSVAKNGEVFVNVGEVVDGVGSGSDIGTWPGYFVTMPDVPDATGAAQALVLVDGQTKRVIGIRDNRAISKVGDWAPGDSAQLSGGKARVFCKKQDDIFSAYTEMADGTSMVLTMDGNKGEAMLAVGKSYIQVTEDEITLSVGSHVFALRADMIVAMGAVFMTQTGATCLGFFPAVPVPGVSSALYGTSGVSGVPSAHVFVAP